MATEHASWLRVLSNALRLAVGITILVALAWNIDARAVWDQLDTSFLMLLIAMQPVVLLCWILAGWRHSLFIVPPRPSLAMATRAYILSVGLNLFLPARIAEVIKATYLRRHGGVPISSGFGAILLERLLDAIMIGFVGLTGVLVSAPAIIVLPAMLMLMLGCTILIGLRICSVALVQSWAEGLPRLWEFPARIMTNMSAVVHSTYFGRSVILSIALWAMHFAANAMLLLDQPLIKITPYQAASVYAATLFAGALPALPGGFGAYEAAGVFVLSRFGDPVGPSFGVILMLHLGQLVLSAILGCIIVVKDGTGIGSLIGASRTHFPGPKPPSDR